MIAVARKVRDSTMIKYIDSNKMGKSTELGWLNSTFHFSFADYYNPKNMNFGVLRVINDDLINAGRGFDTHPHKDMEIISYVVNGRLTHGDSMGNNRTIERGQIQYMSAGTGVYHSEYNYDNETARFLQIWILPDKKGHAPAYGDYRFELADRDNKWLYMVSSVDGGAPVKIHQDMNIYSLLLSEDKDITFSVEQGRQAYLVLIEGDSTINGINLRMRDGLEIVEEELRIHAEKQSHFILLEMQKE